MKIVTWNIGVKTESLSFCDKRSQLFDDIVPLFSRLNAQFANALMQINADFVCLQEAHSMIDVYSQTKEIAKLAGFRHYKELPLDDAHSFKVEGLKIGVSVLSRHRIIDANSFLLTNPNIKTRRKDGKVWRTHDKGFLSTKCSLPAGIVNIVSIHLLPFHRFNVNTSDYRFLSTWEEIDTSLSVRGDSSTAICGDLNVNDPIPLLHNLFSLRGFKDTSFDRPTHRETYFDHIILSSDFNILESRVLDMYDYSDHYPCLAKVALQQ